jgi:hypothetical protein
MNTIPRLLRLSGSQPYNHTPDKNFLMIGERTNVAGSPQFAKLIRAGKLEDALEVARQQVENGANVIDICFDDGLIDGRAMYHCPSIRNGSARLKRSGERNSLSPSLLIRPLNVPSPSRSTQSSTIRRVRSPLAGTVNRPSFVCSLSTKA